MLARRAAEERTRKEAEEREKKRMKAEARRDAQEAKALAEEQAMVAAQEADLIRARTAEIQAQREHQRLQLAGVDEHAAPRTIDRPRGEMAGVQILRTSLPAVIEFAVYSGIALVMCVTILLIPVGLILGIWALIRLMQYLSMQVEVTNRAFKLSYGVLAKTHIEMRLRQVESVTTQRTLLGAILGYSTLVVQGTGSGIAYVTYVKHVESAKRDLDDLIEYSLAGGSY